MDPRDELIALLPRLRRFALGLTGSRESADDLVQTGCLRALERWHQWTPGTSLHSWMFRILQTVWLDQKRMESRRPTISDDDVLARVPGEEGERNQEARDLFRAVRGEIARLPDDQKVVLLLVTIEGLSYREAAGTLGVPVGTIMSRLARARQRIAKRLEDDETEH